MSDSDRQPLRETLQNWARKHKDIISNNLPSPCDLSVGPVFVLVFPQEEEFWGLLGSLLREKPDIYSAGAELERVLNQVFEAERNGVRFRFLYDPEVGYAIVIDSIQRDNQQEMLTG
jgi:hypothetical protein